MIMSKKSVSKKDLRNKHRLLRVSWFLLTLFLVSLMVFVLYPVHSLYFILLLAYMVSAIMFVIYEVVLLHELYHEKPRNNHLIHNCLVQLYLGSLSLLTATITLVVSVVIGLSTEMALVIFIGLTLGGILLSYPQVEEFAVKYAKK